MEKRGSPGRVPAAEALLAPRRLWSASSRISSQEHPARSLQERLHDSPKTRSARGDPSGTGGLSSKPRVGGSPAHAPGLRVGCEVPYLLAAPRQRAHRAGQVLEPPAVHLRPRLCVGRTRRPRTEAHGAGVLVLLNELF